MLQRRQQAQGEKMDGEEDNIPTSAGESPEVVVEAPPLDVAAPALLPAPRPAKAHRRPAIEGLPEVGSLRAQVYALTGAQQVMFERVDQGAKLQEQQYAQMQGLMQQMSETLKLWQESFQALQEMTQKLAKIAAATVLMYQLQAESNQEGLFG